MKASEHSRAYVRACVSECVRQPVTEKEGGGGEDITDDLHIVKDI